jgi:hypothetical protein
MTQGRMVVDEYILCCPPAVELTALICMTGMSPMPDHEWALRVFSQE